MVTEKKLKKKVRRLEKRILQVLGALYSHKTGLERLESQIIALAVLTDDVNPEKMIELGGIIQELKLDLDQATQQATKDAVKH